MSHEDLTSSKNLQRAAAAAGIALAAVTLFRLRLNTDVGWFLFLAERLDAGELLYVDRVEINLPWIVHLSQIPTMLARWANISDISVLRILLLLATFASASVAAGRLAPSFHRRSQASMAAVWLWFLLLWMAGSDIGEREHLLALALVPYVALRCGEPEPRARTALIVGLSAGIAVALKPHFIPVWMAIEVDRRLSGYRWLRPESVSLGVVLGLSFLLLPLLHFEYFDMIRDYAPLYRGFQHSSPWRFLRVESPTLMIIAAGVLASLLDREFACRVRGFLVAAVAALLVAVWQGKGFTYHLYPAHVFSGTALLLLALRFRTARVSERAGRLLVPLMGAAMCLYLLWGGRLHRWTEWVDSATFDSTVEMVRQQAEDGSVLVLSPNMLDAFPMVNLAQVAWASRYHSMWPIHSLYGGTGKQEDELPLREPSHMSGPERLFFQSVVDDLLKYQPAILLVDEGLDPGLGGRFDYLGYLAQDTSAARELALYVAGERRGRLRFYKRVD